MIAPTLILIPCLTGAAWNVKSLQALDGYRTETPVLSEAHRDIERHADDILAIASRHATYVLVGDSFGAQIALAIAARRPQGLVALAMSGGFAANPVDGVMTKLKAWAAALLPGPLYRSIVLPMHAQLLSSRYDAEGEVPWSEAKTVALFKANTSWGAYVRRTRATLSADYRKRLKDIAVPTLILTPEDDTLIGPRAAGILREGIAGAREVVLRATGHMFRFSHPRAYAQAIRDFLDAERLLPA